jgi:plastocyanin
MHSRLVGRRGRGLLGALVAIAAGLIAVLQPAAAGSADPTIESASDGPYGGYVWRPSSATIAAGGTVAFRSASAVVPHNVSWRGGPETPACSGVPIDEERTSWSGTCAFAQPGAYPFVCAVHPVEMTGTINVSAGPAPGPTPSAPGGSESPLAGPVSTALRLPASQRGTSVRGSIALSRAGTGGRLEIVLLSRRSALGAGRSGTMRVGRLVRTKLKAGRLPFRVSLLRVARRALGREGKLPLVVRITISAPDLKPLRLRRGVILRG